MHDASTDKESERKLYAKIEFICSSSDSYNGIPIKHDSFIDVSWFHSILFERVPSVLLIFVFFLYTIFLCWTIWNINLFWFQSTYRITRPSNERCSFFKTYFFATWIDSLTAVPFQRCCFSIAHRLKSPMYLPFYFDLFKTPFFSTHIAHTRTICVILLKTMNLSSLAGCVEGSFSIAPSLQKKH